MAVDCEPTGGGEAAVVAMAVPTGKTLDKDEGKESDTSTASTEDTVPLSPTSSFSSIRPASPPSQSLSASPSCPPTRSASIIAAERIRARYLQRLGVKVSARVDQIPPLLMTGPGPDADLTVTVKNKRSSLVRFQSVVEVHRFDASIDGDIGSDVDVNFRGKEESESAMAAIERNCREFEMEQWNWQLVVEEDDFIEYNGQLVHPATAKHLQDVQSRYMCRHEEPLTYPSRTHHAHHSAQHQFLRILSAQQQFHRYQRQANESSDFDCEPSVAHGYFEDDF